MLFRVKVSAVKVGSEKLSNLLD